MNKIHETLQCKQCLKLESNKIFLDFKKLNHAVIFSTDDANANKIISRVRLISTLVF